MSETLEEFTPHGHPAGDTVADLFDFLRARGDFYTHEDLSRYPHTRPESAREFTSIPAMRAAVTSCGSHYFDRAAVRFFLAKTDGKLFGGRFWVESVQFEASEGTRDPREYRVCWVAETGGNPFLSVEHVGRFEDVLTARYWAREMAYRVKAASERTTPQHVDYPHEPGRLHDCPACDAACHCDPAAVATGRETECVFEGEHTSPPAWLLWWGGASYSHGYTADDTEAFPTAGDAVQACADRYLNRDGMTPGVGDDSESWLFLYDPRGEADPYPAAIVRRDDSGDFVTVPA